MIRLPYMIYSGDPAKKYNVSFGGLDLTERASEGELRDSRNVDTSRFPYVATRNPKFKSETLYDPAEDRCASAIWGDGETFATFMGEPEGIGDTVKFRTYGKEDSDVWDLEAIWTWGEEKHDSMVRCGSFIVAFPDQTTANESGNTSPMFFDLGASEQLGWTSVGCTVSGMAIFSGDRLSLSNLNVFGGYRGQVDFKVGDSLTISDCRTAPENCMTLQVSSVEYVDGGLELVFDGASFTECVEDKVEVSRRSPENIRFPVVVNNRIWGVTDSEICACAWADPTNWEQFEGISSDSYKVAVDSGLEFTGSGVYNSNPVFFKENALYRMYGSLPSNFTLQRLDVNGVMEGCHKSVCKINEALYYKGRRGIYRYSGGIPACISESLGDLSEYCDAVAGEDGRRLYISMRKGKAWDMFVYDTETGIWLREDGIHALGFAKFGSVLYYLGDDMRLHSYERDPVAGLTKEDKEPFEWSITFAPVNETVKERKVYSKITLRMELESGAYATVLVNRDGLGWEEVTTVKGCDSSAVITVPITPKKCDSFSLRIQGEGKMCLKTLIREYRTAGDR